MSVPYEIFQLVPNQRDILAKNSLSACQMVPLNQEYINRIPVFSVSELLREIRNVIQTEEDSNDRDHHALKQKIIIVDDIYAKCVAAFECHHSTTYYFIQISSKNGGTCRLSVFGSNKIKGNHHFQQRLSVSNMTKGAHNIFSGRFENIVNVEMLKLRANERQTIITKSCITMFDEMIL